jgi:outer membrane protein TolC
VSAFPPRTSSGLRGCSRGCGLQPKTPMKQFFPLTFGILLCSARAAELSISVSALVAEITANNPELKFYEAEIAGAKAGRISAAARTDPEIALDLGRKRVRESNGLLAGAVPVATYVELQNSYLDAVEALLDTQREAMEAGLKLQQLTGLDFNAAVPASAP